MAVATEAKPPPAQDGVREEGSIEARVPAALRLLPAIQNYEWGVRGGGDTSLVSRMAQVYTLHPNTVTLTLTLTLTPDPETLRPLARMLLFL